MNEKNIWNFASESIPSTYYTVQRIHGKLICNCPASVIGKGSPCRHIRLVENNLAGVAINREPEIVPADVREITITHSKILLPTIQSALHKYKVVKKLRELGISKRRCEQFFGQKLGSDKAIEEFLSENRFKRQRTVRSVTAFALVRC